MSSTKTNNNNNNNIFNFVQIDKLTLTLCYIYAK